MLTSGHAIELRHLRYFLAVYDELHFGRAARRLHIAQPPLSRAIRQLERELGVELFTRSSRAVQPTPAGEAFAEEAGKVLAQFDYAVTQARRSREPAGALRIGCTTYFPMSRLLQFLAAIKERDGGVEPHVRHLTMREQLKLMRAGELDLGIFMYAEEYEDMAWTTLFPGEPVVAYLPCDHPLTAKDVLTPEDLADETQVMFPRDANPPLYDYWEGLFASAGFRFRSRYEWNMDEPSDLLLAVASGFGVAFGLQSVKLAPGGSEVTMRPTEPQLRTTDFVVVWREDAPSRLQERLAGIQQIAAELRASAD